MSNPVGSAKSLKEVIEQAAIYINQVSEEAGLMHRLGNADKIIFEKFIRDFLSQYFCAEMIKAENEETQAVLDKLWKQISS